MIFSWVQYQPITYGDYVYPPWAIGLGWGLSALSLVCIPLGMLKGVVEAHGDSLYKVGDACCAMPIFVVSCWEFHVLVPSKIISGSVLICDSAHLW